MLLELAIADAYSVQWKNRSVQFIQTYNDLSSYSSHTNNKLLPGCYTGNIQMNIAIVEMLVLKHPLIKEFLANSFVVTFKRDPRSGYLDRLEQLLSLVNDGRELIAKINPYNTQDNCAIRAIPLGILSTPERVIKATITQAAITNNNPDDLNASLAVGLMSHYFIYCLDNKERLKDFLDIYIDTRWLRSGHGNLTRRSLITIALAIEAIIDCDSLSQLLQRCISTAENFHQVAAIAVATASCSQEYQQDLPRCLIDNLENTKYGRDYLINLDRRWMELTPSQLHY